MRSFDGQKSDSRPVRRTQAEKGDQLRALKARLAGMKSHESAALRGSIEAKIRELEAELGGTGKKG